MAIKLFSLITAEKPIFVGLQVNFSGFVSVFLLDAVRFCVAVGMRRQLLDRVF